MTALDKTGAEIKKGAHLAIVFGGEIHTMVVDEISDLFGLAHVIGHIVSPIDIPAGATTVLEIKPSKDEPNPAVATVATPQPPEVTATPESETPPPAAPATTTIPSGSRSSAPPAVATTKGT